MTIAQLKRHMDRRFAMTNRKLQGFATKGDLRRFATKKDLRRFATKEDLRRFATKEDLAGLEGRMNRGFGEVMRRLDSLNAKMDSNFASTNAGIGERDRIFDDHEKRLHDLEAQAGR